MIISIWHRRYLPLFEFALRIYIAYYLADYGYSKLTGDMFNNATPEVLKTELQKVDLFHLTWYFFQKVRLLSYTVGVCQILSAGLLLFNKTVLWGCALALPILFTIVLVDVSVLPDNILAIRVSLYLLCILLFIWYRKNAIILAYKHLSQNTVALRVENARYFLAIPVILSLYLFLEIAITRLGAYIF